MIKISLVDDHKIFCDSLTSLINDFPGYTVVWTAHKGQDAINYFKSAIDNPDILLLDINLPDISGIEVAKWIAENNVKTMVIALTMEEDDASVVKMLQYGVRGYLLKTVGSEELQNALQQTVKFGYYYTPIITQNIHKQLQHKNETVVVPELNPREKELLIFFCTDMNYMEIAAAVFLSESTIDTYRARLFEKFEVKNRIGLILKAIHLGLVKI
jgi:DNA-binding NarL/FixJ family response regulator